MRLEEDHAAPAREARGQRTQRGADLGRVMAVVVDDDDASRLALHLHPAVDTLEGAQGLGNDLRGDVELRATAAAASEL